MTADENLPPPLVDAAVNLSALRFMPVDVRHLLASPTWILAAVDDPQIGHALISLWAHSWHQIPPPACQLTTRYWLGSRCATRRALLPDVPPSE